MKQPSETKRQEGYFERAIKATTTEDAALVTPGDLRAIVKAAITAVVPGRQKARNFDAYISAGCAAGARTLRRRLKK